jgi:DNA-binding FadR family transcriptional regulator
MKLQVVSNRKLYLQIADQIREQIAGGAVAVGSQLPSERELAQSLGVSRPTVREALIALEVAGLVEVRVGVGAFVKRPNTSADKLPEMSRSPTEIMSVRRLLEPEAARLAAINIAEAVRRRLSATIERMRTETQAGLWSAQSDEALHLTIAEATDNAVLRETLESLWNFRTDQVDTRFHQHLADIKEVREHILADHEAIAARIIAGDPAGAEAAMARHLEFVSAAMTAVWE